MFGESIFPFIQDRHLILLTFYSLTIYIMFKRKNTKRKIQNLVDAQYVTMSSIDDREDHPETLDIETLDDNCILAD